MQKSQIFYVHGGMTFPNKQAYLHFLETRKVSIEEKISWNDAFLKRELGNDFDIVKPRMPCQDNAKYREWKICFERYLPYINDDVILIGASLWGIFLAKYLSENIFPKRIRGTYLVCPPFDNTLPNEELTGGFRLRPDLTLLEKNSPILYLLFSKNDDVIPVEHARKYADKLKNARVIVYDHIVGHFTIPEFPEIVELIRNQ